MLFAGCICDPNSRSAVYFLLLKFLYLKSDRELVRISSIINEIPNKNKLHFYYFGLIWRALPQMFPGSTVLSAVPSPILAAFTDLLTVAAGRRWLLLWRSSRDGGAPEDFHRLCDHQGPTITLIRDADGNVFGGYTSAKWSSHHYPGEHFMDFSAFLFTVVNPHADPPALFPSTTDGCGAAVFSGECWGPCFGINGSNLGIRPSAHFYQK